MEVLELENYLLLNNSTETSHHKFSVATAQEVQTELCFLALGSFHILYLQFYFWTQLTARIPLQVCLLFTVHYGRYLMKQHMCLYVHGCISHHCSLYSLLLSSYDL